MKKSDLRTGMIVTLCNGEYYYVMLNATHPHSGCDILVHRYGDSIGWMPLERYDDNLCYHDDPDGIFPPDTPENQAKWDIAKVEEAADILWLFSSRTDKHKTIWERT